MRIIPDEQVSRTNDLCDSWTNHRSALNSVRNGVCLRQMPVFIKRIIDRELWRNIWLQPNGRVCCFDSFKEYVEYHTPDGLGANIATLKNICRDNLEALAAIDAATQGEHGGNHNPEGLGGPTGRTRGDGVNVDNIHVDTPRGSVEREGRPAGTSRDAALRRLRKDRPDLLERVVAGEVSPHAAMLEAGFRKKKSPKEQIVSLIKKCSDEDKIEIFEMLENDIASSRNY